VWIIAQVPCRNTLQFSHEGTAAGVPVALVEQLAVALLVGGAKTLGPVCALVFIVARGPRTWREALTSHGMNPSVQIGREAFVVNQIVIGKVVDRFGHLLVNFRNLMECHTGHILSYTYPPPQLFLHPHERQIQIFEEDSHHV